jgi:AcrR family transcriptional regulator
VEPDRPPRQKLTLDRIIAAALGIIDRDGLEGLSTRSLGAALGVKAMALYHYVANKDDMLDKVAAVLIGMQKFPDPSIHWRAQLMSVSLSYVAIARRHPRAFVLLANRRFNTPEALAVLDRLLAIFVSAGLPPDRAAAAFRSLGYLNNGAGLALAATIEAANRPDFRLEQPDFLSGHPSAAAVMPYLGAAHLDRIHDYGLTILLDGIAADIAITKRS